MIINKVKTTPENCNCCANCKNYEDDKEVQCKTNDFTGLDKFVKNCN